MARQRRGSDEMTEENIGKLINSSISSGSRQERLFAVTSLRDLGRKAPTVVTESELRKLPGVRTAREAPFTIDPADAFNVGGGNLRARHPHAGGSDGAGGARNQPGMASPPPRSAAFAHLIAASPQLRDGHCWWCGSAAEPGGRLKSCAKCLAARYCSVECQTAHWKAGHKAGCGKAPAAGATATAAAAAPQDMAAAARAAGFHPAAGASTSSGSEPIIGPDSWVSEWEDPRPARRQANSSRTCVYILVATIVFGILLVVLDIVLKGK